MESEQHTVIINDKSQIKASCRNVENIKYNLELNKIEINYDEINDIIKGYDKVTFWDCIIHINTLYNNMLLDNDEVKFINCEFMYLDNSQNIDDVVVISNEVKLLKLDFHNCNFNNLSLYFILNASIRLFKCYNIGNITISNSNLTDLIIDGNDFNKLILSNSVIATYSSYYSIYTLDADRILVTSLNISDDVEIGNVSRSSPSFNYGIFGRKAPYDLIGYKKASLFKKEKDSTETSYCRDIVLKLVIPKDSLIYISDSGKARSNKVIPVHVYDYEMKDDDVIRPLLQNKNSLEYKLNKEIYVYDFDESHIECSTGIHFFLNLETAKKYII